MPNDHATPSGFDEFYAHPTNAELINEDGALGTENTNGITDKARLKALSDHYLDNARDSLAHHNENAENGPS